MVSVGPAGPHWSIWIRCQTVDFTNLFQLDQLVLIGPSIKEQALDVAWLHVSVGPAGPHWSILGGPFISADDIEAVSVGPAGPHWSIPRVCGRQFQRFQFQLDQLVLIGPSRSTMREQR